MADFVKAGEALKASWANQIVTDIRSIKKNLPSKIKKGGGSAAKVPCAFGTLGLSGVNHYIQGGVVYCGDQNINITNNDLIITNTSNRTKLVYFEIPVTVNKDDDDQILLPNIDTTSWTPALEEVDVGTGYPDNTQPTLPSANGTLIVPLGTLTVSGAAWSFVGLACGNINCHHCAGTLSFTRGDA